MNREQLDEVWDSVYYTDDLSKRMRDIAPGLIEFLMSSLLEQEDFEIGLFHQGENAGSCVAYDTYSTDKILELRYKQDTSFELYLALEDDDYEMQDFYYTLSDKDTRIIPEGIQNLMKQAWDKGETRTFRKGTIEK
ncbi:MAG: hypothetical protein K0S53_2691 [Bacteroidetes bacterium]|jgi:hypothetical protein|nr:hypothetical protein [Bacteroidota bacterium]